MNIKQSSFVVFFLSISIVIIIGVIGIKSIKTLSENMRQLEKRDMKIEELSLMMQKEALTHRRYEKDFFLNIGNLQKQKTYLTKFNESQAVMDSYFIELDNVIPEAEKELHQILDTVAHYHDLYGDGFLTLTQKITQDSIITPQKANKMMEPIKPHLYTFESGIDSLVSISLKEMEEIHKESEKISHKARLSMFLFSIGGTLLLATLLLSNIGQILSNLSTFTSRMKDLTTGDGDLTKRIELKNKNEFHLLATYLNSFLNSIHELIKKFFNNTETLYSSSKTLTNVSTKLLNNAHKANSETTTVVEIIHDVSLNISTMTAAAEEISMNATNVASMAEQSSANINSIASAVEEMSTSINEIAGNAREVQNISETAVEKSQAATATMNSLDEAAKSIGKVSFIIKRIAEQTNLLALNATIEAASTGEAGKGFAVVANEIKELANQSAQAADDIANRITGVQNFTTTSVAVMEEVSEIIHAMENSVEQITTAVEQQRLVSSEISANVTQASTGSTSIAHSIAELAHGASDVSHNAGEASISIQNATNRISEVQDIAQKTNEAANSVHNSADALFLVAEELQNQVKVFRI